MTSVVSSLPTAILKTKFNDLFGDEPLWVRSPGRVNLLGEHTDYNEGFVLPAAIDKAIYVGVSKREDQVIQLYAVDFKESFSSSVSTVQPTEKGWPNYILGVVDQLNNNGYNIGGFNLIIDGDVPLGAGLSSSAAVECATIFALNALFDLRLDKKTMTAFAQKAEHSFAGVRCGIMDQFAGMFGKKDHVIKLDCRSLEFEYVPFQLQGFKLLLLNTNVKHSLASSEYNTRRAQCEQGVAWAKKYHPEVQALRDVSLEMLDKYVKPKDELIYRRCKYVVEENTRLLEGCEDLKRGDIKALGQKMFQTHEGLSRAYEVSCKELDFLVDGVKGEYGVLGARMMGGGFGGCTINLIKEDIIDKVVEEASRRYKAVMGLELTAYTIQVENGSELITQKQIIHV
jgi:galactokinase